MGQIRTLGYVRLSRDEDRENYDSIIAQKKIIETYCSDHALDLLCILEDDNVSGYTFNRPGLNKLKEFVKEKKIDVIVVKDLSRLGRHNAKTLLFLEYLEDEDVRVILINDNYDSNTDQDDIIGIKTWYNERYLKDISRKIKSTLKIKQKDGMVVKVPYGYERDPSNKHALIVDEEAADIVRRIFKLYIEGFGGKKIANILDKEGVLTPSKYQYIKTGSKPSPIAERWHSTHVIRIIKNDIYIGTLRCGKTETKKINGLSKLVDEKDHIVHENYHEPIISLEEFQLAQKILNNRLENGVRGTKGLDKQPNLFTGFLECLDCGSGFMKKTGKKFPDSYICCNNFKNGSNACSTHKIHESQLKKMIIDKLVFFKSIIQENIENIDREINAMANIHKDQKIVIAKFKKKIKEKQEEIKNYSRQLAQNIISYDIATELIKESTKELDRLTKNLEEMERYQSNSEETKEKAIKSMEIIDEIVEREELTRKDLELLLKKIYIQQINMATDGGPHPKRPILSVHIEWDIFISSLYQLFQEEVRSETLRTEDLIEKSTRRRNTNEDT